MFCHRCGKEVTDGARFCYNCGAEQQVPAYPQSIPTQQATYAAPSGEAEKRKTPSKRKLMAVIVAVFGFVVFVGGYYLLPQMNIQNKAARVVYLEMYDWRRNSLGSASGFFIEDGRTLVTNYHVIEGAHIIEVFTADGSRSTRANIVVVENRSADIAILWCLDDLGVEPLRLANSDNAKQGDKVFAVGYPLGVANTLSDGIISSRYYDENDTDVLQVTAAISPGSSGGALFNSRGDVIGVTSAYYDSGENMTIAISSNTVRNIYKTRSGNARSLF